jgi:hypothetical protein
MRACRLERSRSVRSLSVQAILTILVTACPTGRADDRYVAVDGAPSGQGTKASPWDAESALNGSHPVHPGDTLWLKRGTYRAVNNRDGLGFTVKLAGTASAPVQVRAVPGERVTIDGGLNIQPPSTYLWIRDLEVTVSEPRPPAPVPPDPTYKNVGRPWGGLNVYSGTGCKFINLVIHNNNQGVSWWSASTESELYGCILYDNGWAATDRGHGHAIYTQNDEGLKTIADCIMTGGYGYSLHAYGSKRADVNNYLAQGNIVYNAGAFLIGGGKPSRGIRVKDNVLYNTDMRLGYDAPYNEDCEVRNNTVYHGSLTIDRFRKVVDEGNKVTKRDAPRTPGVKVVFRVNRYDADRANMALLNGDAKPETAVDFGSFLRPGDRYRLMNPRDFYGKPVLEGTYRGKPVTIPLNGEFVAFVVFRSSHR